jgi:CheY-like chemotaxis protein
MDRPMTGPRDRLAGMVQEAERQRFAQPVPERASPVKGEKQRVLLYAPSPAPARAYLAVLEAEGWEVLLASEPDGAETLLRATAPELILAVAPALSPELAKRWQKLAPSSELRIIQGVGEAALGQVVPPGALLDFTVRSLTALVSLLASRGGLPPERIGRTLQLATGAARELGMNRRDLATVRLAAVLREVPALLGEGEGMAEGEEATEPGWPEPRTELLEELATGMDCPLPVGSQEPREHGPGTLDVVRAAARLAGLLERRDEDPALSLRRQTRTEPEGPGSLEPAAVEAVLATWKGQSVGSRGDVLVVDGDTAGRVLLALRLRNEGYSVRTAGDGREALDQIRQRPPDLVLSEIVLARLDGLALLDALRKEGLGRLQVVFLSGRSDPASVSRALMLGAADYLSKPVSIEILLSKLQKILGHSLDRDEITARLSLAELANASDHPAAFPSYHELQEGTEILRRFRVEDDLGEGGMGRVLKARDLRLEEIVVLKVLKPALAEDGVTLSRFKREIRLARRITHPGVVRIFDFWEAGTLRFVTMEYLEGSDLNKEIRRRGAFPVPVALRIVSEVLEALSAAHAMGVLHRDIKPHNILLLPSGRTKVLDFGIAQGLEGGGFAAPGGESYAQGTPEYMSPEQVLNEPLDVRSDLYSTGVLAFELLTGELPFEGESRLSTARRRLATEAPRVGSLRAEIPDGVERWVARLLQRERDERFPSAPAALEALKEARI